MTPKTALLTVLVFFQVGCFIYLRYLHKEIVKLGVTNQAMSSALSDLYQGKAPFVTLQNGEKMTFWQVLMAEVSKKN